MYMHCLTAYLQQVHDYRLFSGHENLEKSSVVFVICLSFQPNSDIVLYLKTDLAKPVLRKTRATSQEMECYNYCILLLAVILMAVCKRALP